MCLAVELSGDDSEIWRRYVQGTHPFPSRTRRLRPARPMVLCWRRHGRAGGRQNKKEVFGRAVKEDGREDLESPTHLENRIYDNLAEHELQA